MTDSFVTQCPHCQTSFRVSHAQLSVARGMVRCGSCLQVFNAAKQLLEQRAKTSAQPPAPAETAPIPGLDRWKHLPSSRANRRSRSQPASKRETRNVDMDSLDLDEELARLNSARFSSPRPSDAPARPATTTKSSLSAPVATTDVSTEQ